MDFEYTKEYLERISFQDVLDDDEGIVNMFVFYETEEGHSYWWNRRNNLDDEARAKLAAMRKAYYAES